MKLNVELRNIIGKNVKKLRREDKVPAVVYSKHLEKPISILCDRNEFVKLYRQTGYSTPITLTGEGVDELVLIQDIQLDPVRDRVIHIDFLGIKKGVKVSAEVAIVISGEEMSPIVKSGDANFELLKDYLMVNALPKDLVKEIVVDVSAITDLDTVIFVKDLNLPEGIVSEEDGEIPVVTVVDLKKSAAEEEAKEAAAEATEETTTEGKGDSSTEETPSE
ncbi:MAG: 50S ribosomal protein L25 [Candidatus Absconditabacterales bacterium]|nr:50S ribosomal protein L25 [Candidatus Absconditabacterales bacterium]